MAAKGRGSHDIHITPSRRNFAAYFSQIGKCRPPCHPAQSAEQLDPGQDAVIYNRLYAEWFVLYRVMRTATVAGGLEPLFTPPGGLPYRAATRKE